MTLTLRQRTLIHVIVQRFDRETQTTRLDLAALSSELMATPDDLAHDIDVLVTEGYAERIGDGDSGDIAGGGGDATGGAVDPEMSEVLVLNPTDRAVMSAMGLE